MKILLLGKTGQLGTELQRSLTSLGELVAIGRHDADYCGDLLCVDKLVSSVRQIQPYIIVNAAAYTAVDHAQVQTNEVRHVNAVAPDVLAREATALDAWLVHYSTDYVFSGRGSRPWVETDPTKPLNVYGQAKLEGDVAVQAAGCKHLILRTSWLYSRHRENFASMILQRAQTQDHLAVVNDQFGAPIGADLLADLTVQALVLAIHRPELSGLYHVTAQGETTWFTYAQFVLEQAQQHGFALRVTPETLEPISSETYGALAPRPANSRLNTGKFCSAFGLVLPRWQDGVARLVAEL